MLKTLTVSVTPDEAAGLIAFAIKQQYGATVTVVRVMQAGRLQAHDSMQLDLEPSSLNGNGSHLSQLSERLEEVRKYNVDATNVPEHVPRR